MAAAASELPDPPAIARRRRLYRPAQVEVLLVGESAPAGGTHFYRANSNLFRAVRAAFTRVYGARLPDGEEFLGFLRAHRYWLVDLADEPVNHLDRRLRRAAVQHGIPRLARTIRATKPGVIVVVLKSIEPSATAALRLSGCDAELVAPPFPTMGWGRDFDAGLARVVRRRRAPGAARRLS